MDCQWEGLRTYKFRVRSAAFSGVERADCLDLVGRKREVENIDVLGDSFGTHGFGNRAGAYLDLPAQDDLRRTFSVFRGEVKHVRVGQRIERLPGCLGFLSVTLDTAYGRPRLRNDPQLLVCFAKFTLD